MAPFCDSDNGSVCFVVLPRMEAHVTMEMRAGRIPPVSKGSVEGGRM